MKPLLFLIVIALTGCSRTVHWEGMKCVYASGEICLSIIPEDHDYYVNIGFPHNPKAFTTLEAAKKYAEGICR